MMAMIQVVLKSVLSVSKRYLFQTKAIFQNDMFRHIFPGLTLCQKILCFREEM